MCVCVFYISCLAGLHRLFLGVLLAVFYTIMNSRFPLEYMNSKMYSVSLFSEDSKSTGDEGCPDYFKLL